ncbi:MAG: uncharacterized protein JWN93_2751, partial [Hyphomicrobiales bacterium]|nr:uncharacterized protein [Hyphomicrobiales bacterium]
MSAAAIILAAWRLMSIQAPPPAQTAPEPPAAVSSPSGATPSQATGEAQKSASASPAAPQVAAAPAASATAPAPAAPKPSFDVVRVESSGETVVAGRAAPKSRVALLASGKPIAEAEADSDGQFVILPPSLAPGDHMLALSAGGVISDQTVAVVVPQRGQGEVLAALTSPGQATRVLAQPGPKSPEAKAAPTQT